MPNKSLQYKSCVILIIFAFCKISYAQFINGTNVTANGQLLNGDISNNQLNNAILGIDSFTGPSNLTINNESLTIKGLTIDGNSAYKSTLTLENYSTLNVDVTSDLFIANPGTSTISINSGSVLNVNQKFLLGGNNVGVNNVEVKISGTNSALNVAGAFIVGNWDGDYSVLVQDGATLSANGIRMEGLWRNSSLTVQNSGTLVTDSGTTEISDGGLMSILDGAVVTSNKGLMRSAGVDPSTPYVLVRGSGSKWEIANDLEISYNKGDKYSHIQVDNGGLVKARVINSNNLSLLSGDGTFETTDGLFLNSGAVIEPGYNSTPHKTMNITGNLTFNSGSTYNVSADAYSNDRINVSGTTILTNGVANVVADGTTFLENHRYIILQAGSLGGTQFSNVTTNYAFLDALLGYDNQDVYFELKKNNSNYFDYALTPNQKSTAVAISNLNRQDLLDDYIDTVSKSEAPNAFDFLSGEIHSTLRSSLLNWSSNTGQASLEQLRAGLVPSDGCNSDGKPIPVGTQNCLDTAPITGWAQVIGNWRQTSSDGNAAKSKANTGGLLLGADYGDASNGWRVGAMFGYGMTDDKSNVRRSSAKLHNYTLGLHAGKRFEWGKEFINVMGGLSYTHHSIKTDRQIPRVDQLLQAKYSGNTMQAFGEVGYAMAPIGKWLFEPFVGLNVFKQKVGSFEETGGFAGVNSKAEAKTYTTATLGLHAQSDVEVSGKPLKVRGTVGLKQALGNKDITRTMSFNVGSSDYLIWGVPRSSSTLVLGAQAQMALSPTATLEAGFSGEFGRKVREQALQARVRWAF